MVTRELIPASWTTRLFLIAALTLLCAFARPVAPAAALDAPAVACALPDAHAARIDAPAREAALRETHGRLAATEPKLSRDGQRARRAGAGAAARPTARAGFAGFDDAPPPRLWARAHPATGPPGRGVPIA